MVDGCTKMKSEPSESVNEDCGKTPCVVVDLDGTLLRDNSLRMMVRFMTGILIRRRRYGYVLRIAMLLTLRRLRVINHVRMKRPLHEMALGELSDEDILRFADQLHGSLDHRLMERLEKYRSKGYRLLLATAAPDLYPGSLAEVLGFDGCIATPLPEATSPYIETRCERKRDLCLSRAAAEGWSISVVATDHADDLPLLELHGITRLLVSPAPELTEHLRTRGLEFEEI